MNAAGLHYWMEQPTEIECKLSTIAQEWFSSYTVPFCQRQSVSSALIHKADLIHTFSGKTKRGMVSFGLCFEGSGKPAILSTTAYQAKSHSKSWANAQRPTPDRCERSSSSQIARLTPHKVYQTFQSGNKSTTLIQYVNRNITSDNHNELKISP